jgi:hypothetical protein
MTVVLDRSALSAATVATQALPPAPARSVTVVVDGCCEVAPVVAAALQVRVMPRQVVVDGKLNTLDGERTLHPDCWPQPPHRIAPSPYRLGDLAAFYRSELEDGRSVLAIHLPSRLDRAAQVALAARSILLAGQSGERGAARVAIYEAAVTGPGLVALVEAAAGGAAAGMTLSQVLMLLERAHAAQSVVYLTSLAGPAAAVRHPQNGPGVGRIGSSEVWQPDRASGLLQRRARSFTLADRLFHPGGLLAKHEPTLVHTTSPALLERVNRGRAQADLPPLVASPGGCTLSLMFAHGTVAFTTLPDTAQLDHLIAIIRRVDQTAPAWSSHRRGGE